MTIIGLKELRQNATQIAERAQAGESFTVVKRSKPVFNIVPSQNIDTDKAELKAWTKQAIERYKPALKALSKQ